MYMFPNGLGEEPRVGDHSRGQYTMQVAKKVLSLSKEHNFAAEKSLKGSTPTLKGFLSGGVRPNVCLESLHVPMFSDYSKNRYKFYNKLI